MKEINRVRQYILWNGDDEYEIMDSSGNCVERYQQGMMIDGVAGRQIGQGTLSDRFIKDHLGSVQRVIRENGTEENEYIYDSFGNIIYQSGTLSNQRLYTSRYHDSESGLYYYRARYYDSNTGRFISEDPMKIEKEESYPFGAKIFIAEAEKIGGFVISLLIGKPSTLESDRGSNLYIYAENNPVSLSDLTGLKSKKCCGTWLAIAIRV